MILFEESVLHKIFKKDSTDAMIKVLKLLEAPGFGLLVPFNFAHREANWSLSRVSLLPKDGSRTMYKRISQGGIWWGDVLC